MTVKIIERGRGPEIEGTRITVYRIMDYVRDGDQVESIAAELRITPEQVKAALEYIGTHWDQINSAYDQLLERDRQGNPPWVEALRARTPEELKERIRQRQAESVVHADHGGQ
jgi:uncharacterized protein (DUF433 family)